MIVAITGGTGFIGRKLVARHLTRGDEVRILSRRAPDECGWPESVRVCRGDLASAPELGSFVADADVLYHCAAEINDPSRMAAVHLGGTRALLDAAAGRIGRWVQLSSTGAYGPVRKGTVTEETALHPFNLYETTKAEADALVTARAAGGLDHVILRPSIVYGARMTNRSLFGLISMIRRGLFFFIGPEGASANYIHVDNVIDALLLCGTKPEARGRVYNVSDHRPLEEFVALISAALGRVKPPAMRLPEVLVRVLARLLPGSPLTDSRIDALTNRVVYSNERIERELGFQGSMSMEEGLRELVAAWREQHPGS